MSHPNACHLPYERIAHDAVYHRVEVNGRRARLWDWSEANRLPVMLAALSADGDGTEAVADAAAEAANKVIGERT